MGKGQLQPIGLRCEYSENPIGVTSDAPRLSWELESAERAQWQSAYRIQVATEPHLLHSGNPDLWDSGKVVSAQTAQVVYAGKPLHTRQTCYWQVTVWDQNNKPTVCSQVASWAMGLLAAEDWVGSWIGMPAESSSESLTGCPWIWHPNANEGKPSSEVYFRRTFHLDTPPLSTAWLLFKAENTHAKLYVNGLEVARGENYNLPQWVNIGPWLQVGTNVLSFGCYGTGNSPGLAGRLYLECAEWGRELVLDHSWRVSADTDQTWTDADFDDSSWVFAHVQGQCMADSKHAVPQEKPAPSPHLRREFSVTKPVKRARLYATALGVYELWLNGQRVSNDHFTPGWTDYRKRIQYQVYDVSTLLAQGTNVIGAVLGDGWYTGSVGGFGRAHYGQYPLGFLAQLEVEFTDGTNMMLPTDTLWQAATGPIVQSDLQMGEIYDARREINDWHKPNSSVSGWVPVNLLSPPNCSLVAQQGPTVRITQELEPVALTQPTPGVFIFDLGQNMVGTYRLTVNGPMGNTVTLRFGEMLNDNGTLYTENLRSSRQTDVYILKGSPVDETYEPAFTFHGFRYIEVSGFPGTPDLNTIRGLVMHSDCTPVGTFVCSDEMVNQLQSNIVWGQRGNFLSIPTDCPQRDERCGWTGDAQVFVRTACMNMDVAGFFAKYVDAVTDGQLPTGSIAHIAPAIPRYGAGSPAWGDACVIVPWTIYQVYGDTRILDSHYNTMKRWVAYLEGRSTQLIRPAEGFGDWLSVEATTPKEVVATAYFAYSTHLLAKIATVLGYSDDAKVYSQLFTDICASFNKQFVQADGRIYGDTQTCYLLALHMELLPTELRNVAAQHLVRTIEEKQWHLSTGFIGVSYLMPVLTSMGYPEVAYRLLHQDDYPSWGYSIRQGATTIWERWNSYTKEHGFGDANMNSFNHYSLGSVGEWFYRYVAGIDGVEAYPGFQRFTIHPMPGGRLTWAKAEYRSIHGRVASSWRQDTDTFHLDVSIPTNTSALVYIPLGKTGFIYENGAQIWPCATHTGKVEVSGLGSIVAEDGCVVVAAASGDYSFSAV